MARKSGTVFQSTEKQVSLSTKIPESLKQRIDSLKERLEKVDPNLTFNVSQIVAETLEIAVKSGEDELKRIGANPSNGAGSAQGVHG